MANIVNFSTYGFLNDILAMNEENWRKYFKPIIYDSVQTGLEVTAGTGMTFNVSAGECRCGSIMGILNSSVSLDVSIGDTDYDRIDSIVAQYIYDDPSTLSIAVIEGTPSASPVSPSLTKSYNILWQIELAQILIPSNATTSTECTITDKRIIYNSLDSIIDPINESINSLSTNVNESINSLSTNVNTSISTLNNKIINLSTVVDNITIHKANQGSVGTVFSESDTYAKDDCVMYQGTLYRFTSAHPPGPWASNKVTETNALDVADATARKNILYYTNQTVSVATNTQIMRIPASGTNSNITTDTVVLECTFTDPSYITSNVNWTSYNGYVTFSGTCTNVTSAYIVLGRKGN